MPFTSAGEDKKIQVHEVVENSKCTADIQNSENNERLFSAAGFPFNMHYHNPQNYLLSEHTAIKLPVLVHQSPSDAAQDSRRRKIST